MRPIRFFGLAALALLTAGPLAAQASDALYTRWVGYAGFQFQTYSFTGNPAAKSASEWAIPVVAVAPLSDKMSLDLTAHYADGSFTDGSNTKKTLSGFTDTQLRLLYTLGRDRAVASLSVNLPTGVHTLSTNEFAVSGALGSNFLSFPMSDFGTAFGVTGGLAYAVPAGAWNVGVSGAVRYTGSYTPLDSLSYKPGVEFRGRFGADRLIGQSSRILFGLTASTFSNDQLTGAGSFGSGTYKPGLRFIGDAGWTRAIGSSVLSIAVWDYYRGNGTVNDTGTVAKENVFNAEARMTFAAGRGFQVEPLAGYRMWNPGGVSGGHFVSGGVAARYGISDQLSGSLEGRYNSGWVLFLGGQRTNLTGAAIQVLLRYEH